MDSTRSTATEEGVADTDVSGCEPRKASVADFTTIGRLEAADPGIGDERWQERVGEVRVINHIEELRSQLHVYVLGQGCVLVQSDVPLFELRTA
ncbi:hypothetical protein MOP44_26680 [Occallatibacter riparius]|uniref:Uncharacterized protein n=1 Tax=Occallatibacter riparius TaxID=1002689 RepID=A0A9J7BN27_9BACT|nr:hypothetical protein [Occallatibacter riparius]UWZ84128.1 hypothetical protein MOP44_26680 [Occallatibacter riparius]